MAGALPVGVSGNWARSHGQNNAVRSEWAHRLITDRHSDQTDGVVTGFGATRRRIKPLPFLR